ncbi:MAG TPA: ATP synthase A1 subunit C [Candidatus Thermoplasmatota archaeon]|nr:ATP synthase A1 subunit C [Candidatus Thermoplasmatota archaeon]
MVNLFGLGVTKRRGGNYPYVTARVRAKKAHLLPSEIYPKLLARDVNEIARTLQEGEYAEEIDRFAGKARGALLIERATRLNLGRTYQQILDMSEGELKVMIGLYLERYDIYNLKTILRGKFAGMSTEEIAAELVPAGAIPLARLEALAKLDNLQDIVTRLREFPYGRGAAKVAEGYGPTGITSLTEIENALDREYYTRLIAEFPPTNKEGRAFRSFLEREVDIQNLRTVLRLRAEEAQDMAPYFIECGTSLTLDRANRLLKAGKEEFASEVLTLKFGKRLEEGVRAYVDGKGLNPLLTALDKALIESADDFGHVAPLSVLPVVDYLLRKKIEVDNLRIIASGKESGLPDETIEGLLIL